MRADDPEEIWPFVWLHLGFVLTGTGTALLGCILPALSANWHMSDASAGILFAAQFSGSAFGAFLVGQNYFKSIIAGYLLLTSGAASIAYFANSSRPVLFLVFGLGLGLSMTATSMFIGSQSTKGRGATLSILNSCWSLGAVLCPVLTSLWLRNRGPAGLFLTFAISILVVFLSLLQHVSRFSSNRHAHGSPSNWSGSLLLLAMVGVTAFLYVGVESSIGGWMMTYVHRLNPTRNPWPPIAVSCFWFALLCGRALAPVVLRYLSEVELLKVCIATSFLCVSLLLVSHRPWGILLSAAASGLALAPVYPLCMSRVLTLAHDSPCAKWIFGISGLGGALLPWLTGIFSSHYGSLAVGLATPLFALAVMFFLNLSNEDTGRLYADGNNTV
jgi:FHS family glucose/mannose:H+ symporter-like MFS transporter